MTNLEAQNKACEEIYSLIRRTIEFGENNSALIIGPRGSGKTHVLNDGIERVKEYSKSKNCENDLIIVKLSGLLDYSFL
jgi:origin recognition complex subunit 4